MGHSKRVGQALKNQLWTLICGIWLPSRIRSYLPIQITLGQNQITKLVSFVYQSI